MSLRRSILASTVAVIFGLSSAVLLGGCSGGSSAAPAFVATPAPPPQFNKVAPAFYKDYTGPQRLAIDAIAASGRFVNATQIIVLDATMAGPVMNGGPNYYVWGFDRGGAINAPFLDEANVKFNAVVVAIADPTTLQVSGTVNLLNGNPPLPVTVVMTAPDTLEVTIAINLLPSTGLAPNAYLWNLWPKSGFGGTAAAQVASFIPENAMAPLLSQ